MYIYIYTNIDTMYTYFLDYTMNLLISYPIDLRYLRSVTLSRTSHQIDAGASASSLAFVTAERIIIFSIKIPEKSLNENKLNSKNLANIEPKKKTRLAKLW